ncbi:MAG TPA: alpha/beta fold hydrolase [Alphaproteobacteria bacterium]
MTAFSTEFVQADGFRIRYRAAGDGEPLICLHGGGGLRISRAHEMLAERRRVIAFEIPGFGESPENTRSESLEALAHSMNAAVAALDVAGFGLMGNSFGTKLALWMAIVRPAPVRAIVLVAPAAIREDARASPANVSPEQSASLLYAHPDRQPAVAPPLPDIEAKQRALTRRLLGPPRDAAFEARLRELETPVLALFGTADRVTPPTAAHLYREILPNCHNVMVYDAAHAIDAERPEAVASVVEDFLDRQARFLVRHTSGLIHP